MVVILFLFNRGHFPSAERVGSEFKAMCKGVAEVPASCGAAKKQGFVSIVHRKWSWDNVLPQDNVLTVLQRKKKIINIFNL